MGGQASSGSFEKGSEAAKVRNSRSKSFSYGSRLGPQAGFQEQSHFIPPIPPEFSRHTGGMPCFGSESMLLLVSAFQLCLVSRSITQRELH